MAIRNTDVDFDRLEDLVDRHSLTSVIEALADICRGKGWHLEANWQDEGTAKLWYDAGQRLDEAVVGVEI